MASAGRPGRAVSREELRRCDGSAGRAYVALSGWVYDVTESPEWRFGQHRGLHWAGQDLTAHLADAPHGFEALLGFPVVGRLVEDADETNGEGGGE